MLAPGTLVYNRYLVQHVIGQGGMGVVYEATDQRLKSTVALKQTLITVEHLRKAFEREAQLLANLRHPALPKVIDHFTDDQGQFLVMEFIPGDDLATLLARRGAPFPPEEAAYWADQLLDVLEFLHTQQPPIIHRDIKPQNLKLTARGEIILLDFGLARGAVALHPELTSGTIAPGYTLQYAPPEQISGDATDARSDIYSLGATLYHLLTGEAPPTAQHRIDVLIRNKQANDSLRPPHEINPAVPSTLSAVLVRMLALTPQDRFQDVMAMRAALGTARSTVPTELAEPTATIPADPQALRQQHLEELYTEAQKLHQEQNWRAVIRTFDEIKQIDPAYPDPHSLLRSANAEQARIERDLEALYTRAMDFYATEQWAQAAALFKQIVALQPDYRDAARKLADAEQHCQKAEEHYIEGRRAFRSESWSQAIRNLETALRYAPGHRDAEDLLRVARRQHRLAKLYRSASWYRWRGKWPAALEALEEIAGIDSDYRDTATLLKRARQKVAEQAARTTQAKPGQPQAAPQPVQVQYVPPVGYEQRKSRKRLVGFLVGMPLLLIACALIWGVISSAIEQARLTPEQKTATAVAFQAASTAQAIQQATAAAANATTRAIRQATATTQAVQNATATVQAIQNATATMQAAQDKLLELKKLRPVVNESFSNKNSPWYQGPSSDGKASRYIKDGEYVFTLRESNIYWWETWEKNMHNFIAEIDVKPRSFKSYGGIIFGYEDANNFYSAQISADGSYRLERVRGGEWTYLLNWKAHAVISKDLAVNRLTLMRHDNNISIYVNNVLVEETQTDAVPDGQVGLLAGALDMDNTEVHLDNFKLWKLP